MPIISSVGGSKSFGRGNIITTVDTAIIAGHFVTWTESTQNATVYTYKRIVESEITFTSQEDNSSFILWTDISCYQTSSGGGMNNCYYVKIGNGSYTAIAAASHNGQASEYSLSTNMDGWMGSGHSGVASSFNLKKPWIWSPNQPAGTSLSVSAGFGVWGGTGNECRTNYAGYSIASAMSVMEFVNPE